MQNKFLLFLVLISTAVFAQKKPLDHSVYDSWQAVGTKQLSNNGLWAAYAINPQEGDSNLYFHETITPNSRMLTIPRAIKLSFSNDSKFAASAIRPMYRDIRLQKIKKTKPDDQIKDTLGIINLTTLNVDKIPRVKSFAFPEKGPSIIAYSLENEVDTTKKNKSAGATNDPAAKKEGTALVVKNLITGVQKVYPYVTSYTFSKNGKHLVFACSGAKKDKNVKPGVFLLNTENWTLKTLAKDKGTFKNFTFHEDGEHLAFLGETDPIKKQIKDYSVYYTSLSLDTAQILVDNDIPGMPVKFVVSEDGRLTFSKDATKLFFGIAPVKSPKDTTLVDFENAKLDIWGYKDDYLQTMQLKNSERETKRSYLSVIDIYSADPKIVPLADVKLPDASLINEGNSNFVLASTDYGNRAAQQWTGASQRDYYLVDTKMAAAKKL